jgi:hypothetical protein
MTVIEFVNEKLCPAGVVSEWDETVITTAIRLGYVEMLASKLVELADKAGMEVPVDLTL